MSTFGCKQLIVKTRKPHICALCNRNIPVGFSALHQTGMWEGDWQNWYACQFCADKVLPTVQDYDDEISDEDFKQYILGLPEAKCLKCGGAWNKIYFDVKGDSDTITYNCQKCGHEWIHQIYGIQQNFVEGGK